MGDNHFGSNLRPPPLCGKIWGNRSPHRPRGETEGRGIGGPWSRAPPSVETGVGVGRAADGGKCPSREWFRPAAGILSGDPGCPPASPRRSWSPGRNTLSGQLTPKRMAPRTGPLRPPLLTSLFSQPRLHLQQGPCSMWPRGQGSGSSGIGAGARIPCPSPWGAPSQHPLHTPDRTPREQSWGPAPLTFLRTRRNQTGS